MSQLNLALPLPDCRPQLLKVLCWKWQTIHSIKQQAWNWLISDCAARYWFIGNITVNLPSFHALSHLQRKHQGRHRRGIQSILSWLEHQTFCLPWKQAQWHHIHLLVYSPWWFGCYCGCKTGNYDEIIVNKFDTYYSLPLAEVTSTCQIFPSWGQARIESFQWLLELGKTKTF